MFKPNKMLRVVSVIMVIFGIIGLIVSIFGYKMVSNMGGIEGIVTSEELFRNLIISIISGCCCILTGFFGKTGKSLKLAMLFGGIYTIVILYSIMVSFSKTGFSYMYFLNIIIPVLFWWSIFQSIEE